MIHPKLLILVALFLTISSTYAKAPMKFGKISMEEMEMTTYEPDSSASAVVLCKYGYFNANELQFTSTRRVKILKKAGVDYSTFVFRGDKDVFVRAKVFNLENGKIIEEKVKNESIFKERVTEDYYRIRIALPNVKVGTVYDIEYAHSFLPIEFAFQEMIPIKHSELVLEESHLISFRKRSVGYETFKALPGNKFIATQMPAFKKEAYVNSIDNYITKFEFDILSIHVPGMYKSFTTSWEAVNKLLREHDYFGGLVDFGGTYWLDVKKRIEATCSTPYKKMEAAYDAVKKVKWNEYSSLLSTTTSLSTIYKDSEGNSAELNFMLLQLLRKLDIDALPVAMSTRSNGLLNPFYPSLEKLNYVIVRAEIDGKEYLLDATADLLPMGMLPKRCLNQQGRLITENSGRWVDLKTDKSDRQSIIYALDLKEDLSLEGNITYSRQDYDAYDFRRKYNNYASEEEYLQNLEEKYEGLRITNFELENLDSIKLPIKDKYDVKIKNMVQQVGDLAMIDPFLFEKIDENPFKLEKRNYPVDFAYNQEKTMISRFTIPENYTVTELPKPIRIKLPDNTASVLINYTALGNKINVTYKFKIAKPMFMPDEYDFLKQFYAVIIEKHAEPIIIKRNADAASL